MQTAKAKRWFKGYFTLQLRNSTIWLAHMKLGKTTNNANKSQDAEGKTLSSLGSVEQKKSSVSLPQVFENDSTLGVEPVMMLLCQFHPT